MLLVFMARLGMISKHPMLDNHPVRWFITMLSWLFRLNPFDKTHMNLV